MKIKDGFVGCFVEGVGPNNGEIGWIKGITRNSMGEIIFIIRWSGNVKTGMPEMEASTHPNNVEKLK